MAPSIVLLSVLPRVTEARTAPCACIPSQAAIAASFELAAAGRLPSRYPHLPRIGVDSDTVPDVLLEAIGWVESGWHQFDGSDVPLVSANFGYGLMQITSGMAGAFGNADGRLSPLVQSRIAGDYRYNIAYGARLLADKWSSVPIVGAGDPTVLEDWYYAVWAYNGWGWMNNPNNPRFSRIGTPATDPASFPYQDRVYYYVSHPPRDAYGDPLWPPTRVSLPSRRKIRPSAGPLALRTWHRLLPGTYGAVYDVPALSLARAGSTVTTTVRLYNTGGVDWIGAGDRRFALAYRWKATGPHADAGRPRTRAALVQLPRPVLVGASDRITVHVRVPKSPGPYGLWWDLVAEPGGSFSRFGVKAEFQLVQVVPAEQQLPTPTPSPVPGYGARAQALLVARTSPAVPNELAPGAPYVVSWMLFNPGPTWSAGFHTRSSSRFAGSATTSLSVVPRCRTVNVVVHGLAPRAAGSYRLSWRLVSDGGQAFGPILSVVATVARPSRTPTPAPSPSPSVRTSR